MTVVFLLKVLKIHPHKLIAARCDCLQDIVILIFKAVGVLDFTGLRSFAISSSSNSPLFLYVSMHWFMSCSCPEVKSLSILL